MSREIRPEHLYKFAALFFFFALAYRFFDTLSRVFLLAYAAAILAVLLTKEEKITIGALPAEMIESMREIHSREKTSGVYDLKALQEVQEREMIVKTLKEVRYNKSKAARILNIDRKTLYLKMDKYGIE